MTRMTKEDSFRQGLCDHKYFLGYLSSPNTILPNPPSPLRQQRVYVARHHKNRIAEFVLRSSKSYVLRYLFLVHKNPGKQQKFVIFLVRMDSVISSSFPQPTPPTLFYLLCSSVTRTTTQRDLILFAK